MLAQIRLTTSKTRRDSQHSKLGIRVASRVAERLKGNIRKISNLGEDTTQYPVSLPEIELSQ